MRNDRKPAETIKGDHVEGMVPPGETPPPADPDPTPARKGRPPKSPAPAAASAGGRPSNRDKLAKSLAEQYVMMGALLFPFAPTVAQAVIASAEGCGSSLASWAETNARVRKALERVATSAGFVGVVGAHVPILLAAVGEVQSRTSGEATPSPFAAMFAGLTAEPPAAA